MDTPIQTAFAAKLQALLDAQKLSYQDAADAAGVSKATVFRWMNKGAYPDLPKAYALATWLGVTTDYLADDAQDDPPVVTERGRAIAEAVRKLGEEQALDRLHMIPPAVPDRATTSARKPAVVSPINSIEVRGVRSSATPVVRPQPPGGHRRRG